MSTRWIGPAALLLFSLTNATWASASPQSGPADQAKASEQELKIDVSRLPINLARIQRQLRQSTVREDHNGLNLRYIIDVYGQAPPLQLLTKEDNLVDGPVPYGGPNHREVLQMITPQEHRAPAADFGNLFRWLSGKAKDKSDK
jgi:hypothetical protein